MLSEGGVALLSFARCESASLVVTFAQLDSFSVKYAKNVSYMPGAWVKYRESSHLRVLAALVLLWLWLDPESAHKERMFDATEDLHHLADFIV